MPKSFICVCTFVNGAVFLFHFFVGAGGAMPHLWDVSRMACGMLVPQLGIESRPLAVKPQSPKHLASREFSYFKF